MDFMISLMIIVVFFGGSWMFLSAVIANMGIPLSAAGIVAVLSMVVIWCSTGKKG